MDFGTISTVWANLNKEAQILFLAEPERMSLAEKIGQDNKDLVSNIEILDISTNDYWSKARHLSQDDLLIVLLTMDGFMKKGYRETFSPFSKPAGLACKYIFIRLDIPEASLLTGLNTDFCKVENIIQTCSAFLGGKTVHVTAPGGTDVAVKVKYQELLPWNAQGPGGNAFLPPAEITEELDPHSVHGVIVADITVGELRFYADLIDPLGLVDEKVVIRVENGLVGEITGGDIARRLKKGLDLLDKELQVVVELGHGLSDLSPTGIIGVDESMNGTCHFGIGERNPYHVDVVVKSPRFTVSEG